MCAMSLNYTKATNECMKMWNCLSDDANSCLIGMGLNILHNICLYVYISFGSSKEREERKREQWERESEWRNVGKTVEATAIHLSQNVVCRYLHLFFCF